MTGPVPRLGRPTETDVWKPADPASVQLVACGTRTGKGDLVERCEYSSMGSTVGAPDYVIDLRKGIFDVTLYEAATGAEVATMQIHGEDFIGSATDPDSLCQDALNIYDEEKSVSENFGGPTSNQLREALSPHVV